MVKTCHYCLEDKEPQFNLVCYKDDGRMFFVYFCSYECLLGDVSDAEQQILGGYDDKEEG